MTNEYGSDSQPPEHEHEEHEATHETPAHEGEPGVWTDDQPPHDDFGSANEETATVSQEAATEAETEETAAPEQRQSRSMLPILAGLAGILLLGGVIYLQFGRSSSPPPPMRLTPSQTAQKPAETSSSGTQSATSATTSSAEADIGSLYKPAGTPTPINMPSSTTAIETMPSPVPPPGSEVAVPTPTVSATQPASSMAQVPESTVKQPSSTAANNSNAMIPTPQTNPANPAPPMPGQVLHPQPAINMPSSATANADAQQLSRLNALTARIDTLQKSLDQVTNMVAAVPNAPSHANPNVENRLSRIEQTLTKIESDQAAKGTRQTATPAMSESTEETPRVTHSMKAASSKHKRHTKSASVSHHKPASAVSSARISSSRSPWVLRAATPKEAWVSTDATSPDLRHIQIGESLPGVGVIRSIRQIDGGWVIEGSTGVIR